MSKKIILEIDFLEKTLLKIKELDINHLDFNSEAALVRHFEVVGGIAQKLDRYGSQIIKNDQIWQLSISTRNKISHSYYSLNIKILIKAIEDIPYLLSTIEDIKKELAK